MSTDELPPEPATTPDGPIVKGPNDVPRVDPVLQSLVEVLTKIDSDLPVTVSLQGVVITGKLVGVREYFRLFAAQWQGGGIGEDIASSWVSLGETAFANFEAEQAKPPEEREGPLFLYLKDASFVMGSHMVPTDGSLLWRGRLSEVSGFSLGILTKNP